MGGSTLVACIPPVGGDCFSGGESMDSKQCGLLPSYTVDAHGKCKRFTECSMIGRTSDPKCMAKTQK